MPIGIITNVVCVIVGGILGAFAGNKFTEDYKEKINMIFGVCSIGMGVSSIILMENLTPVIFSVIVGTMIGLAIHLGDKFNAAATVLANFAQKKFGGKDLDEDKMAKLVTVIVLFSCSATGIYGSICEGFSGEHSILLAKSVLDIFTAMIFASTLGIVVCFIAVPQIVVFMCLFILAGFIYPITTPTMVNDFRACGGIVLVATGFRMARIKDYPIADMIPALILVMPVSWLWTTYFPF